MTGPSVRQASVRRRSGAPWAGALLLAGAAVAWAVGYEVAAGLDPGAPVWRAASLADTLDLGDSRPFRHSQHEGLSCVECHASADDPGIITIRSPLDCASCHHDPGRGYSCQACHAAEQLDRVTAVEAHLSFTVWEEPGSRPLPFAHEIHGALECRDCHTAPVTLAVTVECAACHQDHHRPEADCTACHVPAPAGAHGLEVHLTCASAGCHGGAAGERPELTRNLCLTCHVEQRDHEPGLTCQQCHMIPEEAPRSAGAGAFSSLAERWLR